MIWQELMPWAYTWVAIVTVAVVLAAIAVAALVYGLLSNNGR